MGWVEIFANPFFIIFLGIIILILALITPASVILLLAYAFTIFLVISFSLNLFLVIRKNVPRNYYFNVYLIIIPISLLSYFFTMDKWPIITPFAIAGLIDFSFQFLFQFVVKGGAESLVKTKFASKLLKKERAIPHPLSLTKYFFKDFSAEIMDVATITTKQTGGFAATSLLLNKRNVTGAAGIVTTAKLTEAEFGSTSAYVFEVEVKNPGYTVVKKGLKFLGEALTKKKIIDEDLFSFVKGINKKIADNITTIYFIQTYQPKPVLRICFKKDFVENHPTEIYNFIGGLKTQLNNLCLKA